MAINLNDNLQINASKPIDARIVSTVSEVENIPNKYDGLLVVVVDEPKVLIYRSGKFYNIYEYLPILKAPSTQGVPGQILKLGVDGVTLEWADSESSSLSVDYNDLLADLTTLQSNVRRSTQYRNTSINIATIDEPYTPFVTMMPLLKVDITTANNLFLYCNPKIVLERYSSIGQSIVRESYHGEDICHDRSGGFKRAKLYRENIYGRVNEFEINSNSEVIDIIPERYIKANVNPDNNKLYTAQIGARNRKNENLADMVSIPIWFRFVLELTIDNKIVSVNLNSFLLDFKKHKDDIFKASIRKLMI